MSENEDILIETTNTTNVDRVDFVKLMNQHTLLDPQYNNQDNYEYSVNIYYTNDTVCRRTFYQEEYARKFYEMVTGIKEKTYIITVDFEQIGYKLYNKSYDEIIETVKKEKGGDFRKIIIELIDDE